MESIKQILINTTDDMPPEEKAVVLSSIETVFAPIDPNFTITDAELRQIEGDDGYFGACSDEFFN